MLGPTMGAKLDESRQLKGSPEP
eukprot:SAG31_NODE_41179_length_277_cov_0.853933_2_plen_22_part_01